MFFSPPPPDPVAPVVTIDNDPMLLGNPSNAITDINNPKKIISRTIFTIPLHIPTAGALPTG